MVAWLFCWLLHHLFHALPSLLHTASSMCLHQHNSGYLVLVSECVHESVRCLKVLWQQEMCVCVCVGLRVVPQPVVWAVGSSVELRTSFPLSDCSTLSLIHVCCRMDEHSIRFPSQECSLRFFSATALQLVSVVMPPSTEEASELCCTTLNPRLTCLLTSFLSLCATATAAAKGTGTERGRGTEARESQQDESAAEA